MDNNKFTKKLLHPLFSGIFVVIAMGIYYLLSYVFRFKFGIFDIEELGITETLTYLFYGFSAGIAFCCAKDFIKTPEQNTFFIIMFLWFAALLREMGAQHWLTSHDTTVTKLRFFTSSANPLSEKIIAGLLMLIVTVVFIWIVCKYLKQLIAGFFKFQTIPWTFAVFSILTLITQIADRFPANYLKSTGTALAEPIVFFLKILEEGGESLLPLLFAIALLQYHYQKTSKKL